MAPSPTSLKSQASFVFSGPDIPYPEGGETESQAGKRAQGCLTRPNMSLRTSVLPLKFMQILLPGHGSTHL
jgi:hypothetical protein